MQGQTTAAPGSVREDPLTIAWRSYEQRTDRTKRLSFVTLTTHTQCAVRFEDSSFELFIMYLIDMDSVSHWPVKSAALLAIVTLVTHFMIKLVSQRRRFRNLRAQGLVRYSEPEEDERSLINPAHATSQLLVWSSSYLSPNHQIVTKGRPCHTHSILHPEDLPRCGPQLLLGPLANFPLHVGGWDTRTS